MRVFMTMLLSLFLLLFIGLSITYGEYFWDRLHGVDSLSMRMGKSSVCKERFLYIDNVNHYMIIDGVGHRLQISDK